MVFGILYKSFIIDSKPDLDDLLAKLPEKICNNPNAEIPPNRTYKPKSI